MKKKIILFTVIAAISIFLFAKKDVIVAIVELLTFSEYQYNLICSPSGKNCITVINYTKVDLDSVTKKYIVMSRKKYKLPIEINHIEFPPETNVVILWESDNKCKIISNMQPTVMMEISKEVSIEMISDNIKYEHYAEKYPQFSL